MSFQTSGRTWGSTTSRFHGKKPTRKYVFSPLRIKPKGTWLFLEFPTKKELFDAQNENARRILDFVNEGNEKGGSVLIHSGRGQSRACCAIVGFLMMKYQWGLFKTLEFLNSRRSDLEIRTSFFHQLEAFESRMKGPRTNNWLVVLKRKEPGVELEERVIRNTFLNSKTNEEKLSVVPIEKEPKGQEKKPKIVWQDNKGATKLSLSKIIEEKGSSSSPMNSFKKSKPGKSCLKRSKNTKKPKGSTPNKKTEGLSSANTLPSSTGDSGVLVKEQNGKGLNKQAGELISIMDSHGTAIVAGSQTNSSTSSSTLSPNQPSQKETIDQDRMDAQNKITKKKGSPENHQGEGKESLVKEKESLLKESFGQMKEKMSPKKEKSSSIKDGSLKETSNSTKKGSRHSGTQKGVVALVNPSFYPIVDVPQSAFLSETTRPASAKTTFSQNISMERMTQKRQDCVITQETKTKDPKCLTDKATPMTKTQRKQEPTEQIQKAKSTQKQSPSLNKPQRIQREEGMLKVSMKRNSEEPLSLHSSLLKVEALPGPKSSKKKTKPAVSLMCGHYMRPPTPPPSLTKIKNTRAKMPLFLSGMIKSSSSKGLEMDFGSKPLKDKSEEFSSESLKRKREKGLVASGNQSTQPGNDSQKETRKTKEDKRQTKITGGTPGVSAKTNDCFSLKGALEKKIGAGRRNWSHLALFDKNERAIEPKSKESRTTSGSKLGKEEKSNIPFVVFVLSFIGNLEQSCSAKDLEVSRYFKEEELATMFSASKNLKRPKTMEELKDQDENQKEIGKGDQKAEKMLLISLSEKEMGPRSAGNGKGNEENKPKLQNYLKQFKPTPKLGSVRSDPNLICIDFSKNNSAMGSGTDKTIQESSAQNQSHSKESPEAPFHRKQSGSNSGSCVKRSMTEPSFLQAQRKQALTKSMSAANIDTSSQKTKGVKLQFGRMSAKKGKKAEGKGLQVRKNKEQKELKGTPNQEELDFYQKKEGTESQATFKGKEEMNRSGENIKTNEPVLKKKGRRSGSSVSKGRNSELLGESLGANESFMRSLGVSPDKGNLLEAKRALSSKGKRPDGGKPTIHKRA